MITVLLVLAASLLAAPAPKRITAPARPRRSSPPAREIDDPLAEPAAYNLFAACLRSGLSAEIAGRAAAMVAPTAMARELRRSADLIALGADPQAVWSRPDPAGAIRDLAGPARRSARSGASMAAALDELADRRRSDLDEVATARAERAGVLIAGPLGLCFLPAFVCIGIVPVVLGLVDGLVGGGMLP
ncbi:type II secretion system F family protein [Millisia brevis]|uniref:type II secretion system F family protein n=1 Tax=Millisia brevis TaxID=264148 RepID=UPI00082D78AC|nr:type II secretion system F family protein [Millisia brevis]